jgi:serine/threonine protein kinase
VQVGLKIGEGSFAQVHKGRNVINGQDVAIKMVKSEKEMCLGDVGVSYEDVLKAMHSEVKTCSVLFHALLQSTCFCSSSPQLLPPILPPFLARPYTILIFFVYVRPSCWGGWGHTRTW